MELREIMADVYEEQARHYRDIADDVEDQAVRYLAVAGAFENAAWRIRNGDADNDEHSRKAPDA